MFRELYWCIKNWESLQEKYDSIFLVVDMHALTSIQSPSNLRSRCLSFVAQYVACGIDPEKSTIAIRISYHEHAELMWVLSSICYLGELNRMTQFKDKSKNQKNKCWIIYISSINGCRYIVISS